MNRPPINIHKQAQITAVLSAKIQLANFQHKARGGIGDLIDEAKALRAAAKRYLRHIGGGGRSYPHNSHRECARRRRQLKAGIIHLN